MAKFSKSVESFLNQAGVELPVICGAMYPCSNPELVASVSENGGIGIVQPLSLVYVYEYDFREGLEQIKSLTSKPWGLNIILEESSRHYESRLKNWVDIALEEGCRFFVTALGKPKWVVDRVKPEGGVVYHDVTERKWAMKALEHDVEGFICVNKTAGGHAGKLDVEELFHSLKDLDLPLICAGGIGSEQEFLHALEIGYAGVQLGTRFIATEECQSHQSYKEAIVNSTEDDIVLTERVTGIPLSVVKTPHVERVGCSIGPISKFLFRYRHTKKLMRIWYNLLAMRSFKRSVLKGLSTKDYYQAGKSVASISEVEPVAKIMNRFRRSFKTNSR